MVAPLAAECPDDHDAPSWGGCNGMAGRMPGATESMFGHTAHTGFTVVQGWMRATTRLRVVATSACNELIGRLIQVIAAAVVLSPIWIVGWVIIDNRAEARARAEQQEQYAEEQRLWDRGYRTCLEELVRRRTGEPYVCEQYADQVKGAVNHRE